MNCTRQEEIKYLRKMVKGMLNAIKDPELNELWENGWCFMCLTCEHFRDGFGEFEKGVCDGDICAEESDRYSFNIEKWGPENYGTD